jgi:hypothetical protein
MKTPERDTLSPKGERVKSRVHDTPAYLPICPLP